MLLPTPQRSLFGWLGSAAAGSTSPIKVALSASDAPVHTVDERYLSFTLDLGQIAEPTRFWNPDGSGETIGRPSFDFASERMRNMAAALAPAYLRIGGTEADRVLYALEADDVLPKPPPPFKSVLTAKHVDALGQFALATGLHIAFTVNAGWGARTPTGEWESTQTRALMRQTRERGYPFTVWELGNEPNAWPLFQQNLAIEPEAYARDLRELAAARDAELPDARIAGPATAYWPILGEVPAMPTDTWPPRLIRNYLPRVLRASAAHAVPDVVTWHYYPGLSTRSALAKYRPDGWSLAAAFVLAVGGLAYTRKLLPTRSVLCLLMLLCVCGALALAVNSAVRPVRATGALSLRDPITLDTVAHWGEAVRSEVVALPKAVQLWLGETGSAQVGGEPGVSGRWASALWWLDQLGLLATRQHAVQCRQTLSGADYGLIDDASIEPTPDYWASVLWRRLMGTDVLRAVAAGAPPTLRVYAHRSPTSLSSSGSATITFLAINLGENALELELRELSSANGVQAETWLLAGSAPESRSCTINGQLATLTADGAVPHFPPKLEARPQVPAGAALFVRVDA
jgi:heparanase 1